MDVPASTAGHRATVVIPLHNHAQWIGQLLETTLAQWRDDLALLIIDDGSTDGSLAAALRVLRGWPDVAAIVLRNEHPLHHGVAAQAVAYADTPVLIRADSDDIMLPGRLEALLVAFDEDARCMLVTSNNLVLNEDGVPTGIYDASLRDFTVDDPVHWAATPGSKSWIGATMAFRRELVTDFPPIDPGLCPYRLDIVLAFRSTLLGTHRYISRPLVGWRQHARNTHRVAGVLDPRPRQRESYAALEGMALAQRVRDAAHVAGHSPGRAVLAEVRARCLDTFFAHHETWCRLRNRLGDPNETTVRPDRVPPVPPIITLRPGRHPFGKAGPLGRIAAAWNGFHEAEEACNWTEMTAVIAVHVPQGVDRMALIVSGHPWQEGRTLRVSANLGAPATIRFTATQELRIEFAVPGRWIADMVVLLIEAPEADRIGQDHRCLGAMLTALEVLCVDRQGVSTPTGTASC